MNWDYPIHSFTDPNAEPQTPTRTPTSGIYGAYGDTSFQQTPKLESSFYDPRVTWNTADPYASSPEFNRLPQRFDLTSPSPQRGRVIGDNGNGTKHSLTVESGRRGGTLNNDAKSMGHGIDDGEATDAAKRSAASMQTPPPTSTSRRKTQERNDASHLPMGPGAAAATPTQGSNSTHLETPSRFVGLSPNMFGLQDSPDMFRVGGSSATASPFFNRCQMPWDQEPDVPSSSTTMDMSDPYMHSFDPSAEPHLDIFDNDPAGDTGLETPRLPITQQSVGRNRANLAASQGLRHLGTDGHGVIHSSFSTSPRVPIPQNDDPSMFLSSPARRFGFSDSNLSPIAPRLETRQPYHHQTEESERDRREMELRKLQRATSTGQRPTKAPREEFQLPLPQLKGGRPTVMRSSTHSGITQRAPPGRPKSQNSFSGVPGPVLTSNGVRKTPSKGRTSPLKTQLHSFSRPASASLASPMESLVLKIGKDGRAKTEMKPVTESPPRPTGMTSNNLDVEEASTESDTDSDFSEPPIVRIPNPSYNFPEITPRRPRVARTQSTSRPQSKCSSHSSVAASSLSGSHTGRVDPSRGRGRPMSLVSQQSRWSDGNRHSTNPLGGHSRNQSNTDSDATPEDHGDAGDAQQALKQVLKARKRHSAQSTELSSVSRTSHSLAMATLRSSPPPYVAYTDSNAGDPSSPTTIADPDIATPTMERQNNPSTGTRCVCNSMNNGGHLMIQCESCTHWLHTKCVGLDRQSLPAVYICVYCTQSPIRRGRTRDPLARVGRTSSPLMHKSFGYR